jgi:phosphoribosyl 1,2-cyclic phosphodiesterase
VQISLCGTRGSTPAVGDDFRRYGGHTSCLAVSAAGVTAPELILDAGTGIRAVAGLLTGRPFSGTIALTHLHWDHVHGLPFFTSGDRDDARVDLLLPQPADGGQAEAALERGTSPPHFPITPRELRGNWQFRGLEPGDTEAGPFRLTARQIPHKGGRTYGYRVALAGRSFAYLPDHSPTDLGPGPAGLGAYHAAAMELTRGVDVLLHDSFWLASELNPARTFGHAAAEYAVGLAAAAGAGRVVLLHHRPDRTDAQLEKLAASVAGAPVPVSVGADGELISI